MKQRSLELLAPAANADIAVQAIIHGADAVYMGASSHGARKSAANSIEDIRKVVEFAHRFRAKVYITVNTIVYESELRQVENLCKELYRIGVDALIVQDMALLRLDIPPIALHASTQCDIRTPEKARFLQEVGFSQLVLARELTLQEIKNIVNEVDIPVECFIHGALCVCYSGKCHASCAATGRSANRGECAQICRLPYSLIDANGKTITRDRHLLSLRDFNASPILSDLIETGVSSFKIEGRLKEMDYVKNITSFYNLKLNDIVSKSDNYYRRSSCGRSIPSFVPKPEKSFNRGFTDYFLSKRKPETIASLLTPKSMGEIITDIRTLHNGDGISYFDKNKQYQGVNINKIENGRIITGRKVSIPEGTTIHRTFDVEWQKTLQRDSAVRKLRLNIHIDKKGISATDERGIAVRLPLDVKMEIAHKPMDFKIEFEKLGNTIYSLETFNCELDNSIFIPRSELSAIRRRLIDMLDFTNITTYPFDRRRKENIGFPYIYRDIDFKDNVANSLAEKFYREHGVGNIEEAMEVGKSTIKPMTTVMTTRHCILRELGMCKKEKNEDKISRDICNNFHHKLKEPLTLIGGNRRYRLKFDCNKCEMQLLTT